MGAAEWDKRKPYELKVMMTDDDCIDSLQVSSHDRIFSLEHSQLVARSVGLVSLREVSIFVLLH